jgi:glutamate-1-semialdehyde aminotransferase
MIIEPIMMNAGIILPEPGYLADLKELLHSSGVLLAFDIARFTDNFAIFAAAIRT